MKEELEDLIKKFFEDKGYTVRSVYIQGIMRDNIIINDLFNLIIRVIKNE